MAQKELPKSYEPKGVEEKWANHWEESQTFTPDPAADGDPYSIVIPPPNVTGVLHMGHALNITLQDILCRYHRQLGDNVLWIPGTDHAGIATQNVVERQLKEEGLGRDDLGRDKFIERVWEWRGDKGSTILNQIRRLGASVDWTRERFTMDEGLSDSVREVFVRLYEEGLIYKGNYIINWCPRCHTALADDEVDHADEKGALHYVTYKMEDGSGELTVATTRPETMLADTAIAVHPEDERFNEFIGKNAILPLVGRKLKIIGDTYVDREFGTGCLKVTPAHDMNDWELGRKHNLEVISILNEDGTLNAEAGSDYEGLTCTEARVKILEALKEDGCLQKIEEHDHSVGHCYRCKTVIEPFVSKQWFVSMKPLAEKARAAVPAQTQIYPEHWSKTYYEWLDNIRDWCISRQIWWGHRIPAWYCDECDEMTVSITDPTECKHCGSAKIRQEDDVLDTWFSSALWPFSTLGWPEDSKELEKYYPTSVLVTGFDILFFWVARMMMMGIHFQKEIPFKHVYLHALVRDEKGKKMSKSTGNVIDPLQMIDQYGTDALRFTLTSFAAMGRDIKLSEQRIDGYRNFVNKIWNAARFALMNLPETLVEADVRDADSLADRWILSRLEEVKAEYKDAVENYRFNEMAQGLYKFIWNEFCDWYLEMVKPDLYSDDEARKAVTQKVLWTVLSETMVLLHSIMPYVTQEIWTALPDTEKDDIATMLYPEARADLISKETAEEMVLFQEIVSGTRNIRTELGIEPARRLSLLIKTGSEEHKALLEKSVELIKVLARIDNIEIGAEVTAPKASGSTVVQGNELYVPLEGIVDFDAELARLDKETGKLDKELGRVKGKLSNSNFVDKAPAAVVEKERGILAELEEKHEKLLKLRERLQSAMG
ncbi:MAG: valine--tRNA ligase [Desulfovibrio sp.]